MGKKFHVNKNDEVKECNANKRACRYGDNLHFANEIDAYRHIEEKTQQENGNLHVLESQKKEPNSLSAIPDVVDGFNRDENGNRIYDVYDGAFRKVQQSVEKNNQRLEKAGIEQRFELKSRPYQKITKDVDGSTYTYMDERVEFSLNYPTISYNGYEFESRIEEVSEGNFVAYSQPGKELNGWRPESMECEHCHKNINRNKVYSVIDKDGNRKVVGGNCVELYTGMKVSNLTAMEYDPDKELKADDYDTSGMNSKRVDQTNQLLQIAYVLTQEQGYRSKSYWGSGSTSSQVESILYPMGNEEDKAGMNKTLEESRDVDADEIKKEVQEAIKNSNSDWANNLKVFLNEEYVDRRGRNTVISAMAALHKYRKQKNQKPWASGFIGKKGEKVENVKAKVLRLNVVEERYGYQTTQATKMTLQTEDGHNIFWKTSSKKVPKNGDNIVFNATIKDTWTYDDIDRTKIIRAKWQKEE